MAQEFTAAPDWLGMVHFDVQAVTASGFPVKPPSEWFTDPKLPRLTPLTVDATGRVFGHIASWKSSHIGLAGSVKPPRSRSRYAYFRTGQLETDDGTMIPVGQITLSGGHAPLNVSAAKAVEHYDNTHSAVMDVAAGEDAHGIWVAGAIRPDVDDIKLRAIRASSVSGDWRPVEGSLELVAVCAVNVPGFPIPRALAAAAGTPEQKILALVAAGTEELVSSTLTADPRDVDSTIEDLEAKLEWLKSAVAAPVAEEVRVEEQEQEQEQKQEQEPQDAEASQEEPENSDEGAEEDVPEGEPEAVAESDSEDSEGSDDEPAGVIAADGIEPFYPTEITSSALMPVIEAASERDLLWEDNLPIQFSAEQAEAMLLRRKVKGEAMPAFNADVRRDAARNGQAMPDGRFPIFTPEDVEIAVRGLPPEARDVVPTAVDHVLRRARALGVPVDL